MGLLLLPLALESISPNGIPPHPSSGGQHLPNVTAPHPSSGGHHLLQWDSSSYLLWWTASSQMGPLLIPLVVDSISPNGTPPHYPFRGGQLLPNGTPPHPSNSRQHVS